MAHPGLAPLDLAFSFDTTGSMYAVLDEVRKNISEMLERLTTDIPGLRVALIAHGDYGDIYETEIKDFGTTTADLVRFVTTVGRTGGSDTPECYELVLQQARTHLSWRDGSSRALVLIGDAFPHEVGSHRNKYKIDWKAEVELLRQLGVTVYCVQCHTHPLATRFMDHTSNATGGLRLSLSGIRGVRDFLMAIAYREGGSDALQDIYEKEVRAREGAGLSGDVSSMLGLVRRTSATSSAGVASGPAKMATSTATKTAARRPKVIKATAAKSVTAVGATATKATKIAGKEQQTKRPNSKTVKSGRVRRGTFSVKDVTRSMSSLTWSPWRLVGQPGRDRRSSWLQMGSGSVRRSLVCGRGNTGGGQVAVELAVQPRIGGRRFPLFGRVLAVTGGRSHSVVPFGRLLSGRPQVRAQLLRVLRQGMRVFARVSRVGSSAAGKSLSSLVKSARYAWNSGRSVRCSGVFVSVLERSLV